MASSVVTVAFQGVDEGSPINARAEGDFLEKIAALEPPARALLARAAEAGDLTARDWSRTLRLARTIADLGGSDAADAMDDDPASVPRSLSTRPRSRPGTRSTTG